MAGFLTRPPLSESYANVPKAKHAFRGQNKENQKISPSGSESLLWRKQLKETENHAQLGRELLSLASLVLLCLPPLLPQRDKTTTAKNVLDASLHSGQSDRADFFWREKVHGVKSVTEKEYGAKSVTETKYGTKSVTENPGLSSPQSLNLKASPTFPPSLSSQAQARFACCQQTWLVNPLWPPIHCAFSVS